jgi:hypothetical protein
MNNRTADVAKRKLNNIFSYRIKQSVDEKVITYSNKRNVIFVRIITTVELHKNAKK